MVWQEVIVFKLKQNKISDNLLRNRKHRVVLNNHTSNWEKAMQVFPWDHSCNQFISMIYQKIYRPIQSFLPMTLPYFKS